MDDDDDASNGELRDPAAPAIASPPPHHHHHHQNLHQQLPPHHHHQQHAPLCWGFRDMQLFPGSIGSVTLRFCQFSAAIVSFSVMISASNFSSVTAFWLEEGQSVVSCCNNLLCSYTAYGTNVDCDHYFICTSPTGGLPISFLVAAMVLQCMWSLSVATIEVYALRCGRNLRDSPLLSLFAVGDWITAVVTLAGACASAGIAVLIGRDVHQGCEANYCGKYATAAGMAFLSWLLISASFLFTFWLLATR